MRNKRNKVFAIILSVLFVFSTAGEYVFLQFVLPYLRLPFSTEQKEADFSFISNEGKPFDLHLRGMFVSLKDDFDLSLNEDEIKKQIDVGIYDGLGVDCNAIIFTDLTDDKLHTVLTGYAVSLAQTLNMSVGFSVSSEMALKKKEIACLYGKYAPDFYVVNDFDFLNNDKRNVGEELSRIKDIVKDTSLQLKVGYLLDYNSKVDDFTKYAENRLLDFVFWNCEKSSNNADFVKNAKSMAQLYLKYNIPVSAVLHNELVMTGGEWNDASEMVSQLRLSFYNGILGMVINSCKALVKNNYGLTVSVFSFFNDYNNVEYSALDISDFSIKDNTLSISGTAKQDYPVFLTSSVGECQQKTVGKDLKFTFKENLSVGRNIITLTHKNASYSYVIDVAEDLIRNVNVKCENNIAHIECTSVEGVALCCYLFGEYKYFSPGDTRSDGSVIYYCEYTMPYNQVIQIGDVSIGAYLNGIFDCMSKGSRTPSLYTDNGYGSADTVVVTRDYSETYNSKTKNDFSVPFYTSQPKGATGLAEGIDVYENNVLYKVSGGMKVSSSDAVYIVNGYLTEKNTVSDCSASVFEDKTDITLCFSSVPFTRVELAPQNYYVGYLSKEYNIKECEFEYVNIIMSDVPGNGKINLSDSPLFKSYEWLTDPKTNDTVLRLYLNKKGEFYGYSLNKTGDSELTFSFKHKKSLADITVLIDAGHGGSGDSGTYSFDGKIYERDISLSIAKKLQSVLLSEGINALLLRTDDYNLNTTIRNRMASNINPDYVVSLHCDGAGDGTFGTHTFYYNPFSKPLADSIHKNMVDVYRTYCYTDPSSSEYIKCDMSTNFYPFLVTRITECPSVLVECGYLTNKNEQLFLQSENGQNAIAKAIADGIFS